METNFTRAQRDLALVIKRLARRDYVRTKLAELKLHRGDLKRADFVWHKLLTSFATMGNSRGAQGLIRTAENYERVTFDALQQKPAKRRINELNAVLRRAKVRMPSKKAVWLVRNHDRITKLGGLKRAKVILMGRAGPDGKIAFWQEFDGIGPKYARNIMMDVYHTEFRNFVAVDKRIKGISPLLGLKFQKYRDEERFYLEVAKKARLNGWDLDRIIYWFRDEVVDGLQDVADFAACREALKEKRAIPWDQVKKELSL
jgi:hypothetical protein